MSWQELQSPEDLLGARDKVFRHAARLDNYQNYLSIKELELLQNVVAVFNEVTRSSNNQLHILLVGSGALTESHKDLDLLVCSEPVNMRYHFAESVISKLENSTPYVVYKYDRRRTASKFHSPLLQNLKVDVIERESLNKVDISFLSIQGGNWEDVLDYHQRARLAHSIIV